MTQLKKLVSFLWKFLSKHIPKKTSKNTIMWMEVPMSCNSVEHKNDIMISTINHMEQNIKIKKL